MKGRIFPKGESIYQDPSGGGAAHSRLSLRLKEGGMACGYCRLKKRMPLSCLKGLPKVKYYVLRLTETIFETPFSSMEMP